MPAAPSAASAALSDLSAWAWVKRRALAKRRRLFLKLSGSVLTFHASPRAPIDADLSLLRAAVSSGPRRPTVSLLLPAAPPLHLLFPHRAQALEWAAALSTAAAKDFDLLYKLDKKIGEGAFASVHRAVHIHSGRVYAVKKIKKKQFDMQMARELDREMYAMKATAHPGIIRTHDVFNTQHHVLLVLDLMDGGTLKDNVQAVGGKIPELFAVPIVRQVLQALHYLHARGIVHRDIKLENILCEAKAIPARNIRVADFGYVNFVNDHTDLCLRSLVGTPVYVAPEIISRKPYGCPVDIYAVGVMLYRMLCGSYPFDAGEDDEETMNLAVEGSLTFEEPAWAETSIMCKNFVRALLQPKPERRLTAKGALHHPWIEGATTGDYDAETDMSSPVTPYSGNPDETLNRFAGRLSEGLVSDSLDARGGSALLPLSGGVATGKHILSGVSDSPPPRPKDGKGAEAQRRWRIFALAVLFVIKVRVANGAKLRSPPKDRRRAAASPRHGPRPPQFLTRPPERHRMLAFSWTPRRRRASEVHDSSRLSVDGAATSRGLGDRMRRTLSLNRA